MLALSLLPSPALVPNSRPAVSSRRVALGEASRLALGAAALAATPLAVWADEEVPMSKAKAKIAAAKAAAEAKTAERGYVVPEAQENQLEIGLPGGGKGGEKLSREEKYLAEAGRRRPKVPRSQRPRAATHRSLGPPAGPALPSPAPEARRAGLAPLLDLGPGRCQTGGGSTVPEFPENKKRSRPPLERTEWCSGVFFPRKRGRGHIVRPVPRSCSQPLQGHSRC